MGLRVRDVYNVTISDQWPAEGFDLDIEYPIVIEELAAQVVEEMNGLRDEDLCCSGERFEKNATATPRQSGYLETARAMYEYTYYKNEELTHAVRNGD